MGILHTFQNTPGAILTARIQIHIRRLQRCQNLPRRLTRQIRQHHLHRQRIPRQHLQQPPKIPILQQILRPTPRMTRQNLFRQIRPRLWV